MRTDEQMNAEAAYQVAVAVRSVLHGTEASAMSEGEVEPMKTNLAGDVLKPEIAEYIAENFKVGGITYCRFQKIGKLIVTRINGYSIYARDLTGTERIYYFRQLNPIPYRGTVVSNMLDIELAQQRYHIECNVEPPHDYDDVDEDELWRDYDAACDFHSCIVAEQFTRAQNGGIWAMED